MELKVLEIQRIQSQEQSEGQKQKEKRRRLEPKLKVFQENQVLDNIVTYLNLFFCLGAAVCKFLKASL